MGQQWPYVQKVDHYYPDSEFVIFCLFNEEATDAKMVHLAIERIGQWGFGKDASIGCGRFDVVESKSVVWPEQAGGNACYTLSPCLPEKGTYKNQYFTPFVRFGKHGDILAMSGNPFKNPVLMADEGAVLQPNNQDIFKKPYLGQAITGVSLSQPVTIHQGYSIYLPMIMEGPNG